MTQDPWDYVHITTWNFLPFLLRRVGAAPGWVVSSALAIWLAAIAALGSVLLRLRSSLRSPTRPPKMLTATEIRFESNLVSAVAWIL
jgi:hypothetical protein